MSIDIIIADDSAYLRRNISDIFKENKLINVIDYAKDGKETIKLVKKHRPDVLVLDLVMPKMSGLDAFKIIMDENPTPTIILSAISPKDLDSSVQALLMGAFDYIIKPGGIGAKNLPRFKEELLAKVLLASQSQIKRIFRKDDKFLTKTKTIRQEIVDEIFNFGQYLNRLEPVEEIDKKQEFKFTVKVKPKETSKEELKNDAIPKGKINLDQNQTVNDISKPIDRKSKSNLENFDLLERTSFSHDKKRSAIYSAEDISGKDVIIPSKIIVIGASVGGPRTITTILKEFPRNFRTPILVVQHLSSHFTNAFAENLDLECNLKIKVANDGEILNSGVCYIAPGENHMEVSVKNKMPCIKLYRGTPVNFCMPSIDVLFSSVAKIYRNRCMGILLTGMGSDGVEGLNIIKKLGGKTIAESEQTSILYAMPKFAAEKGYADLILADFEIGEEMKKFSRNYTERE
ncbi:MAG: chemotaxis-specific protein-glutamate methyltransferase CheB [Promethearchaeota archaeon]